MIINPVVLGLGVSINQYQAQMILQVVGKEDSHYKSIQSLYNGERWAVENLSHIYS